MAAGKKTVWVGGVPMGGEHPVVLQSMLNASPDDFQGNLEQARTLAAAGCQLIRVAIPDERGPELVRFLKAEQRLPVVADIHFDYRLALAAVEAGADKIRINPGNLAGDDHVRMVADACRDAGIPIRVGVNSGSVPKDILARDGGVVTARGLADCALRQIAVLEGMNFDNIVVSVKASHVPQMAGACRILHQACPYPQHLGVTEAGTARMGLVKSAVGIGSLLLDGIGDTIRVSLTVEHPAEEIEAAKNILRACGLRRDNAEVISCPTCGRCRVDILSLATQVEEMVAHLDKPLTVAVMGCAVNGPGEARQADIGIAGGDGDCLLFKRGVPVRRYPYGEILGVLQREISDII